MTLKRKNPNPKISAKKIVINAMRDIEVGHRSRMSYDYQGCDDDPCSWCVFIRKWFKGRFIVPYGQEFDRYLMNITRFTFGHNQPYMGYFVEIHHDPEIDPVRLMDTYHGNCSGHAGPCNPCSA